MRLMSHSKQGDRVCSAATEFRSSHRARDVSTFSPAAGEAKLFTASFEGEKNLLSRFIPA